MKFLTSKKGGWLYYILQWTWGLLMNIVGGTAFLFLLIFKRKQVFKLGVTRYMVVGKNNWGGLNLGMFFFVSPYASDHTRLHEAGHSLQNVLWGLLFPFVIAIPSIIRYHYRDWLVSKNKTLNTSYDDIWFEGQATKLGYKYFEAKIINS